ncbi:MAG: Spo0E like sporulation regulatory protein [Pelotomaculum sp. PtaU1.Bin035]|nr:MAG: Spo0E like sporulation regulatory protein [Pelotomaculum sp. PtaU1.Bin035]
MDLLNKIEQLRSKMHSLAASGAGYKEILKVSQQLDTYIVQYHKLMISKVVATNNSNEFKTVELGDSPVAQFI